MGKGASRVSPIRLKKGLVASAINVSRARSGNAVLRILKQGHHRCLSVKTEEIKEAQKLLFSQGIFAEEAAAASVAAAKKLKEDSVVCLLTGRDIKKRMFAQPASKVNRVYCTVSRLEAALEQNYIAKKRSTRATNVKNLIAGVRRDEEESSETLHLTAYENRLSKLAQSFLGSTLSHRYHLSTPEEEEDQKVVLKGGSFMFKGLPGVYALERAAKEKAQRMFHAALTDFRPTSGLHAMICTMAATTEVGDLVYSIDPADGGHFATRHVLERLGRRSRYIPWDLKTLSVDLEKFAKEVKKNRPQAIFFEHGTPLFNLPVRQIRELVGEDVLMIYDASHTQGLIAGGQFQDPLREGCNVLQGNTHKTYPGPQKGMIHFRDLAYGRKISELISGGLLSSQHTHHVIAEYITTLEMFEFAKEYAAQMIENARVLANALAEEGFGLVEKDGVFTTSHEVLIKGNSVGGHFAACRKLFASGISTNARVAFREQVIRLGTQEVTRRGMKEDEMRYIAKLFRRAILGSEADESLRKEIMAFNRAFANIHYSFDRDFGYWR